MEKKNIVFIAQSLDGYIAGKNGELDWLHTIPNPDGEDMGYHKLMNEIDAIVMGRTTYETVLGFEGEWPYEKHVFVLSNSLKEVPFELESKVTLTKGTPEEILKTIYAKGYFKLYIDGGRTVQDFLKANLIDELRITTIPVLLGGGFRLFGVLETPVDLELSGSYTFLNQVLQSHYTLKK